MIKTKKKNINKNNKFKNIKNNKFKKINLLSKRKLLKKFKENLNTDLIKYIGFDLENEKNIQNNIKISRKFVELNYYNYIYIFNIYIKLFEKIYIKYVNIINSNKNYDYLKKNSKKLDLIDDLIKVFLKIIIINTKNKKNIIISKKKDFIKSFLENIFLKRENFILNKIRKEKKKKKYLEKKNFTKYNDKFRIYLKETYSNFFGTITDLKGQVILNVSRKNIEDYNKRTLKFHYFKLGRILMNKFLKKKGYKPFFFKIYFKGKRIKRLDHFVKGFKVFKKLIHIINYKYIKPRAHNGCRGKKQRRK